MICSSCGTENTPGAKFCNECGATLATAAGSRPASTAGGAAAQQPVAERRLVTVLFADIVGFTPFAEERDAEEVRDALSRYFDLCSQVVERYGGTIEKFIGDAVMAVWGTPVAHEDDAERAVRAALELLDAVRTVAPNAQARAGVLSGEAAVTLGATNQGMVAGDLVNTAARLQSVAPPGTALVGEATMRATSGAIVYEEAGEQALKGKQAPVPAWRAVRVVAERGGRNRSESLEAPFVGRADELRLLKDLFHATTREKKIRLVSVMGPAGIGKSRLAWEFLKYIDGLVDTVYWHDGRSPAYGEGITFWALGEMVRGRCGLVEGDDEATTRTKLGETVRQWLTDPAEIEWVERALLTLLGFESGMASDELFGAWRTFFERIAAQGTVALVFEDLHHADSGLLDFIDHMLDWSRGLPIYIVTLARPELLDKRPDWGAGKRSFSSIYLEPLPAEQMRELLAGLVPGLPEQAIGQIVARADGIPLYAVETVRMLVTDGRLREEGGVYVPVGDLAELAVPETLTALISSRLDALDPTDRALVQDAAVLGQSFSIAGLAAVSGTADAELGPRLAGLVRRELLMRQADQRSAEQGQYVFVQALIREVAYNTLSRRDRKARHLAAARFLESLGSDELASALSGHYLAAHENAAEGPEADALAAQTRVALKAAAERAASLGAYDQSAAFLLQALNVTTEAADRADLLERASEATGIGGRHARAIELAREAVAARAAVGDRIALARGTAALGWALLNGRQDREAKDLLEGALTDFADIGDALVLAEIKINLVRAYSQFERTSTNLRGLILADEALEIAEHGNHPWLLAKAFISKGATLGAIGRLREAISLIRAGEEVAREQNVSEQILGALTVRGYYLGEVDNDQARQCYMDGLVLSRRLGRLDDAHQFINNLGYTSFLTGEWDLGLAELDGALADDLDVTQRIWLLSNELIIRVSRGDAVAEQLAELDHLATQVTDIHVLTAPHDTHANLAQSQGRLDDAQRHWLYIAENWSSQAPASYYQSSRPALWAGDLDALKRRYEGIEATGFHGPVVEVRRTTMRAGIAALEGRTREAQALYSEAFAAWGNLKVAWEQALTGLDMATVLDPAEPDVAAAIGTSREILTRLGAKPYMDRLENVVAERQGQAPTTRSGAASAAAVPSGRAGSA